MRKELIHLKRRFKRLSKVDRCMLAFDFLTMTINLLCCVITHNILYFFIASWIGACMGSHIYYQKRIRLYSIGYYYAGKIIGMMRPINITRIKTATKYS